MFAKIGKADNYNNTLGMKVPGASEFLCDDVSDIEDLPTDRGIAVGSSATCIEEGKVFIFSPSRKWVEYGGVSIFGGEGK